MRVKLAIIAATVLLAAAAGRSSISLVWVDLKPNVAAEETRRAGCSGAGR